MVIEIRKPNIEILTPEGIPEDFAQVMKYFNEALKIKRYTFIPRKTPITIEEIKNLWVPSIDKNISYVADLNGTIIGSATPFFNVNSTAYEHAAERKPGEIGLTVKPPYSHGAIGKKLLQTIINELKNTGKTAFLHTDIHWGEEIDMMASLGYMGTLIENYERYKKAGLCGKVREYKLP